MEADVKPYTKARKRTQDAAVDRDEHRDSSSANRFDVGPTCSTSFGMKAKPLALPSKDDALVDKGAAAPKPRVSPVEIYTLAAADGLLPAGTASTATRIIFPRPLFLGASVKRPRKVPAGQTSTSLPLAARRRLFRRKQGKLWCSIQAAVQIVYAPAHFWESGARCFVWRCLFGSCDGIRGWSVFGRRRIYTTFSQEKAKRFVMPCVLRLIPASPKPG